MLRMLSVRRLHLSYEIPIVGCELTPSVLSGRPDNAITTDNVPESAPVDGYYLRFRWYRIIQTEKKVAVCSVHPSEVSAIQIHGVITVHCMHERPVQCMRMELRTMNYLGDFAGQGVWFGSTSSLGIQNASLSNGSTLLNPPNVSERGGDETWYEVGRSKTYTPTADDVGYTLKLECVAVDAATGIPVGPASTLHTSLVIPAPSPLLNA